MQNIRPEPTLTIREWVEFLVPGLWEEGVPPIWPPDVFAIAASILHKSGSYCSVLEPWPPQLDRQPRTERNAHRGRLKEIQVTARSWRRSITEVLQEKGQEGLYHPHKESLPKTLLDWWSVLLQDGPQPISDLSLPGPGTRSGQRREALCQTLIQLAATADEVCEGLGVPGTRGIIALQATMRLISTSETSGGATLCSRVSRSRSRVLPKLHTPQSGLTIRSLSHHLALCPASEVEPNWFPVMSGLKIAKSMNILIVPWPREVAPSHFFAVDKPLSSSRHGLFTYSPPQSHSEIVQIVPRLIKNAEAQVGRIDGIIFPELALTEGQLERIRKVAMEREAFLIAGVRVGSRSSSRPGKNYWVFNLPFIDDLCVEITQEKHHRWRLERKQIVQYGLGGRLHPDRFWWEHVGMQRRQLWFVGLRRWLTLSVLICEDLARQEPVTEIVRAVGPNLVISLLMDGPQLASRWPGRYATVLAEDPGSSVLTLTSLGMARLSRAEDGKQGSRVVALWKDDKYGHSPIELPLGSDGVVLSIVEEQKTEWTADGRKKAEKLSVYPTLNGIYPVQA
jgi:hypothetical protein